MQSAWKRAPRRANSHSEVQHLVDVPPVLPAVVEAFPHHPHDLSKRHYIKGQVSDLRHERGRRAPRVVGGGLANLWGPHRHPDAHLEAESVDLWCRARVQYLDFCLRVVVHDILHLPTQGRGCHGDGWWRMWRERKYARWVKGGRGRRGRVKGGEKKADLRG